MDAGAVTRALKIWLMFSCASVLFSGTRGLEVEFVAHALLLGEHVAAVVFVGGDFHRHVLYNL